MILNDIIQGNSLDVLKTLPNNSVDCVVTSPPYWALRDYGVAGQLGLEDSAEEYVKTLCDIFDEVKRVLKSTGTCWVNIGDSYGGSGKGGMGKNSVRNGEMPKYSKKIIGDSKCLAQVPSRFAIEMVNRGWLLRNEIIWHKPNCMPSSATDRFTVDFEKVFFFVKSKKYYFETAIEKATYTDSRLGKGLVAYENRNTKCFVKVSETRIKRTVWRVATKPFRGAHFATFPEALIEPMIKSGCPIGGVVLDPFMGAGTTALVASKMTRQYLGIELNPEYINISKKRLSGIPATLFSGVDNSD